MFKKFSYANIIYFLVVLSFLGIFFIGIKLRADRFNNITSIYSLTK